MQTLKHNDLIKLATWKMATASVATLAGLAAKYGDDAEKLAKTRANPENPEVFCTYAGSAIVDSQAYYAAVKAKNAAAIVVTDGETVMVDGKEYTVKVMRGNGGEFPRNGDPIHFMPAATMLTLPEQISYDLQPYGRVTLSNLRQHPNDNVARSWDVEGDVTAGTETSYLFGHRSTKPATGTRRIYGVKQSEIDSGHIVRVAM